jgi:hypothetical protein
VEDIAGFDFYVSIGAAAPDASAAGEAGDLVRATGSNRDDQWKANESAYECEIRRLAWQLHGIGDKR